MRVARDGEVVVVWLWRNVAAQGRIVVGVVREGKSIVLYPSQGDNESAVLACSWKQARGMRQLSARSEMHGVGLCGGELQACRLSGCHFIHSSSTSRLCALPHAILGYTCRNRHCLCEVKIASPPVHFPRVYVSRRPNITCFRLRTLADYVLSHACPTADLIRDENSE